MFLSPKKHVCNCRDTNLQFRDARNKKDQIYWETKIQRNEIAQGTPGTYRQNQLQHLTNRTQWLQGNQNFTLSPTKKLVDRFIMVEEPPWCRYISVWRSWCRGWKIWCIVHRTVQGISCHSWHICVFWHGAVHLTATQYTIFKESSVARYLMRIICTQTTTK